MGRAPCCDKANVKRGPWSPDEDAKLKSYIQVHGTGGNWIALPQKIGLKRCGKSCRLRWLNYLRPNIKHGGFSDEEDDIIYTLYMAIGTRWSIIAAQLPGRTDNDIKNYWNTRLKKKLLGKQRKEVQQAARRLSCVVNKQEMIKRENFMAHPDQATSMQYYPSYNGLPDQLPAVAMSSFIVNPNPNQPPNPNQLVYETDIDNSINIIPAASCLAFIDNNTCFQLMNSHYSNDFQAFNNLAIDQIDETAYGFMETTNLYGVVMVNGGSMNDTTTSADSTTTSSWGGNIICTPMISIKYEDEHPQGM